MRLNKMIVGVEIDLDRHEAVHPAVLPMRLVENRRGPAYELGNIVLRHVGADFFQFGLRNRIPTERNINRNHQRVRRRQKSAYRFAPRSFGKGSSINHSALSGIDQFIPS